jgi:hypothetical protein
MIELLMGREIVRIKNIWTDDGVDDNGDDKIHNQQLNILCTMISSWSWKSSSSSSSSYKSHHVPT